MSWSQARGSRIRDTNTGSGISSDLDEDKVAIFLTEHLPTQWCSVHKDDLSESIPSYEPLGDQQPGMDPLAFPT